MTAVTSRSATPSAAAVGTATTATISTSTMTRVAPPSKKSKQASQKALFLGLGGLLMVVTMIVAFIIKTNGTTKSIETITTTTTTTTTQQEELTTVDTEIQLSSVAISIGKIPFYHCGMSSSSTSSSTTTMAVNKQHVMLLHGARFTKEDWKSSGILEQLCRHPQLSVSAMDLPVSAGHEQLQELLTAMTTNQLASSSSSSSLSLPIAGLITPSASGLTMADWIKRGTIQDIPKFVLHWIPVATGSVQTVETKDMERLKDLENFQIFAIYGDQDKMGKQVTTFLKDHANAKTLELPGGHPVYLDSPDLFVQNVIDELVVGV